MIRAKYNVFFVYCDGCRIPLMATFRIASFETYEEARKEITDRGWLTSGVKHYCHHCQNTGIVKRLNYGSDKHRSDSGATDVD